MTAKELHSEIISKIRNIYEPAELESLAFLVQEHFGITKTDYIVNSTISLDQTMLDHILDRLLKHEPIQYVLGYAWFYGRKYEVSPGTLIPRSETEEMCDLVIENLRNTKLSSAKILDIGTGTGCIPITLKKELPETTIHAMDVSEQALEIARKNSGSLGAEITFLQQDVLQLETLADYDVVISNPPYVMNSEKKFMKKNVLNFEPELALYVQDSDPLKFYNKIAQLAGNNPTVKQLYFEINEQFPQQTKDLLNACGFTEVEIKCDLNGKSRIAIGKK